MSARASIAIVFVWGIVFLGACDKKQEQPTAAAGSQQTPVICVRCGATNTLPLASEIKREGWPKVCSSCKKWAAYASAPCKGCGKLVPLKNMRTDSFGYPETCPHCGKPWQQ